MGKLSGKVAIITGGNSGIGEATAKLFAKEGAKVVITARREGELDRVAREIRAMGGEVIAVPGDATVTADVERVVKTAVDTYGTLDILVNNAGQPDCHKSTVNMTDGFWDDIIAIDLTAVMKYCREALRVFVPKNSGVIVNVGSIGGVYGCAGAAYSAAKSGLIGITKNIAIQYHGTGIRANAVHPGSTDTPLFSPENFRAADTEMMELTKRPHVREYDTLIRAEEQASVILFFASDDSSAVNGQNLVVDRGGRL